MRRKCISDRPDNFLDSRGILEQRGTTIIAVDGRCRATKIDVQRSRSSYIGIVSRLRHSARISPENLNLDMNLVPMTRCQALRAQFGHFSSKCLRRKHVSADTNKFGNRIAERSTLALDCSHRRIGNAVHRRQNKCRNASGYSIR